MNVVFSLEFPGIGDLIKDARSRSGMPLTQLAASAQISVAHWNRIENERVDVPFKTLKRIELALGCDLGVNLPGGRND